MSLLTLPLSPCTQFGYPTLLYSSLLWPCPAIAFFINQWKQYIFTEIQKDIPHHIECVCPSACLSLCVYALSPSWNSPGIRNSRAENLCLRCKIVLVFDSGKWDLAWNSAWRISWSDEEIYILIRVIRVSVLRSLAYPTITDSSLT